MTEPTAVASVQAAFIIEPVLAVLGNRAILSNGLLSRKARANRGAASHRTDRTDVTDRYDPTGQLAGGLGRGKFDAMVMTGSSRIVRIPMAAFLRLSSRSSRRETLSGLAMFPLSRTNRRRPAGMPGNDTDWRNSSFSHFARSRRGRRVTRPPFANSTFWTWTMSTYLGPSQRYSHWKTCSATSRQTAWSTTGYGTSDTALPKKLTCLRRHSTRLRILEQKQTKVTKKSRDSQTVSRDSVG